MDTDRIFQSKIAIVYLILFCLFFIGTVSADSSSYGNWTRVLESTNVTQAKWDYGTAVFHDRMWIIGGHIFRGTTLSGYTKNGEPVYSPSKEYDVSEVWSSSFDGTNWNLVSGNASFGPRRAPGIAVFKNRLWVIGGTGLDDVWSSVDGKEWVLETAHAGFSPRGYAGIVVFHGRLWVIAGGTEESWHAEMADDVWSSPNGKTWTQETEHAGFGPRFGYGVVVYKDKIWMIAGKSDIVIHSPGSTEQIDGGSQDVWYSENGANWKLLGDNLSFNRMEFSPVTVFDNKLWLIGGGWADVNLLKPVGYTAPVQYYNEVWSSTDGINWSVESENAGFSPGYNPVIVFNNAIWRIGSDIWYMPLQPPKPGSVPQQTLNTSLSQSETPTSTPSESSTPVKSDLPTQAGIDPFIVCLAVAIGAVLMARPIKKV